MKTFTIEKETNNVTAHPTTQDAESTPGAERFATAAEFAEVAATWPASRLIEIWNSLPGVTAITKFKDRKSAIAKIWNVIQTLGDPAPQAARKPRVVRSKSEKTRKVTRSKKATRKTAPVAKDGARPGGKTGNILNLLKRPGGASLMEIMKATGWQAHSVRGFISGTLGKKMSLTVVSAKTGDGERTYSIQA